MRDETNVTAYLKNFNRNGSKSEIIDEIINFYYKKGPIGNSL